ncbi:MAG: ADP-glyceromanno-heptose 6-epimerase [Candidatus Omnitrophica bacterium]|nr:ADP-glyceromanno-heptose 6-epimerase [Candidatus Omnitrophota bacterium]MCM8825069.1 ADP-glyceromanno-heptose 6-epimerase [Candidatus Omnitrophota bacterium]
MKTFHIVTGGIGFIGSALIWKMNQMGIDNIIIVDSPGRQDSWKNLLNLKFEDILSKDYFIHKIEQNKFKNSICGILHMGACSDTTESNTGFLLDNNYQYTKILAQWAIENRCRFVYASSAATYGNGPDFSDSEERLPLLRPLNMYGYSKHLFDLWAYKNKVLSKVAGLKFFNVFGPNEYHKGDMRSVVVKKFFEIQNTGSAKLFKSYKPEYSHGEQKRDFIYIKDAVKMALFIYSNPSINGIFNIGTGVARSFNDLVRCIFKTLSKKEKIEYIDMPDSIKNSYQYFTCADISKIRKAGYKEDISTLESAIDDYIKNYLLSNDHYLRISQVESFH